MNFVRFVTFQLPVAIAANGNDPVITTIHLIQDYYVSLQDLIDFSFIE